MKEEKKTVESSWLVSYLVLIRKKLKKKILMELSLIKTSIK